MLSSTPGEKYVQTYTLGGNNDLLTPFQGVLHESGLGGGQPPIEKAGLASHWPPSTTMMAPVMYLAAGDAK